MTKLKHCPFCGFKPNYENADCVYPINREKTLYNVVCYETGGGCGASVLGWTEDEAIERWNRRVENDR